MQVALVIDPPLQNMGPFVMVSMNDTDILGRRTRAPYDFPPHSLTAHIVGDCAECWQCAISTEDYEKRMNGARTDQDGYAEHRYHEPDE